MAVVVEVVDGAMWLEASAGAPTIAPTAKQTAMAMQAKTGIRLPIVLNSPSDRL